MSEIICVFLGISWTSGKLYIFLFISVLWQKISRHRKMVYKLDWN